MEGQRKIIGLISWWSRILEIGGRLDFGWGGGVCLAFKSPRLFLNSNQKGGTTSQIWENIT